VVILEIGSHFLPRPVWTMILLFHTSCCSWACPNMPSYWLTWGSHKLYCLISASQVARIAGVSFQHPAYLCIFFKQSLLYIFWLYFYVISFMIFQSSLLGQTYLSSNSPLLLTKWWSLLAFPKGLVIIIMGIQISKRRWRNQ
jgi:hypothetical protein